MIGPSSQLGLWLKDHATNMSMNRQFAKLLFLYGLNKGYDLCPYNFDSHKFIWKSTILQKSSVRVKKKNK